MDHYLNCGINEGRDGGGMFDAVSYANRYEDLKDAFGYDLNKLHEHYEIFGEEEGRNAVSEAVEYSYVDFKDNTIVVNEDKEKTSYELDGCKPSIGDNIILTIE